MLRPRRLEAPAKAGPWHQEVRCQQCGLARHSQKRRPERLRRFREFFAATNECKPHCLGDDILSSVSSSLPRISVKKHSYDADFVLSFNARDTKDATAKLRNSTKSTLNTGAVWIGLRPFRVSHSSLDPAWIKLAFEDSVFGMFCEL